MKGKRVFLGGFSLTDFLVGLALTSAVIATVASGLQKSVSLARLSNQQGVLAQTSMAVAHWYWRNMEAIPRTGSYQLSGSELQSALAGLNVELPPGVLLVASVDALRGQIRTCLNFSQNNSLRCVETVASNISLPSQPR